MAGYSIKDANRALRERKDTRPQATICRQCDDTGFVVTAWGLQECLCSANDADLPDLSNTAIAGVAAAAV